MCRRSAPAILLLAALAANTGAQFHSFPPPPQAASRPGPPPSAASGNAGNYLYPCLFNLSVFFFVCLSVWLLKLIVWIYPPVYPSVYLFVYLSICLSVYLFVCLSIYMYVCLSIYPFVCLSIYLSVYFYVQHLSFCFMVNDAGIDYLKNKKN